MESQSRVRKRQVNIYQILFSFRRSSHGRLWVFRLCYEDPSQEDTTLVFSLHICFLNLNMRKCTGVWNLMNRRDLHRLCCAMSTVSWSTASLQGSETSTGVEEKNDGGFRITISQHFCKGKRMYGYTHTHTCKLSFFHIFRQRWNPNLENNNNKKK